MFFSISAAPSKILSAPTVLKLGSFHCLLRVDDILKKPPTDVLRPIIPDNACILCLIASTDIELVDAYSSDTVISSSPEKRNSRPMGLLPPRGIAPSGEPVVEIFHYLLPPRDIAPSGFRPLLKNSTTGSRRSRGQTLWT